MAAPDPLAGTTEEFNIAHWKECVQSFRPSGANSFSRRHGEVVLIGYVPAAKVRGALRFLLGYDNVTDAAPFLLQRTNPVFHPRYDRFICTSASEEEFKPGDYVPGVGTKLKTGSNPPRIAATDLGGRALYKWAKVTARFSPCLTELADDDAITPDTEWQRNIWVDVEPRVEFLSLDGFKLVIAEGEGNTDPTTNPKGSEFPAPFGQIIVKPDVVFHWGTVPRRYLFGNGGTLPPRLLAAMSKVNSESFLGYPAGTLLLLGAKLTRSTWSLALGTEDPFQYDVDLMMSYFNPTKGLSSNGDVPLDTYRGHNCVPYRGGTNPMTGAPIAGDRNAGRWFLATRTGGNSPDPLVDPRLLEYTNFFDLFKSAPA